MYERSAYEKHAFLKFIQDSHTFFESIVLLFQY